MALPFIQKQVIGGFADFIPHGETVDLVVTSSLIQPDDDPITNWTDYNLGCVTNVGFDTTTENDPTYCPNETGGYTLEDDIRVVKDMVNLTLKGHSEYVFRLLFGLNQEMTGVTGQLPFENRGDRQITGWLRLRGVGRGGEALTLAKLEIKLRLSEYPGWSKDATYPVVSCEILDNALNDLIDDSILPA